MVIGEPWLALSQWSRSFILMWQPAPDVCRTLLAQPGFSGHIIGLDSSRPMLARAHPTPLTGSRLSWQSATCLLLLCRCLMR